MVSMCIYSASSSASGLKGREKGEIRIMTKIASESSCFYHGPRSSEDAATCTLRPMERDSQVLAVEMRYYDLNQSKNVISNHVHRDL